MVAVFMETTTILLVVAFTTLQTNKRVDFLNVGIFLVMLVLTDPLINLFLVVVGFGNRVSDDVVILKVEMILLYF